MENNAACFPELKEHEDRLPVVDCHGHAAGRGKGP